MRGDSDSVLAAMSDDITWIIPGPGTLPYSGIKHGKSEWKTYLAGLGSTEILAFQPAEYLADGNKVVVLDHEKLKVKATGKIVDGDWAQVLTFKGANSSNFSRLMTQQVQLPRSRQRPNNSFKPRPLRGSAGIRPT